MAPRRRRFKPDPDFQITISRAVLGRDEKGGRPPVRGTGRPGRVRRRQVTLQEVADKIIEQAKKIVDDERHGLPSVGPRGQRAKGYDFRNTDRRGRTYRASFRSAVEKERGRLIIVVINDHPHAQDVEYGNGGAKRSRTGGYMRLPITKAAYDRIKAEQAVKRAAGAYKPTEFQKKRAAAKSRLRYWQDAPMRDRARRKRLKRKRGRLDAGGRTNLTRRSINSRLYDLNLADRRVSARLEVQRAERILRVTDAGLLQPKSFVARGRDGTYYLFTKEVKPYRGYGILGRALRAGALHIR